MGSRVRSSQDAARVWRHHEQNKNEMQIWPLILLSTASLSQAEERLSWFATDEEMRKSIFVPDDLPEGKEENRALPWVFHDEEPKLMELKCMMRGFNDSNNPIDYKDARWSHPGFENSQVDTSAPAANGNDTGVPYRIWTIRITVSAKDAGKKFATCEWQQGDFPLSTDFTFLIFSRQGEDQSQEEDKVLRTYSLGEPLGKSYETKQIEDDIKKQICEHYYSSPCNAKVTRSGDDYQIVIPSVVLEGSSPVTIVLIVIFVLIMVAIIGFFSYKNREKIRTRASESYDIVMSKISTSKS